MLTPNQEAYADAATRWAEDGNDPDAFPDFRDWLRAQDDAEQENYLP